MTQACSRVGALVFLWCVLWFNIPEAIAQAGKESSKWPVLTTQEAFQDTITQAIDHLYNRHPATGDTLIDPWRQRYPEHPVWLFWDGLDQWWDILEDLDDETKDPAFFSTMAQTIAACDAVLEDVPGHRDALMIKAVSQGLQARLESNRRNWWAAMSKGRAAMRTLEQLREVDPENSELLFADGLYYFYVAYTHDNYKALRVVTWMMNGDKERGLELLRKASRKSLFVRSEATYFLGNILLNYENRPNDALTYSRTLMTTYPDNLFYKRLYIRSFISGRKFKMASDKIDQVLADWPEGTYKDISGLSKSDLEAMYEELYTWKGRLLFSNSKFEEAQKVLSRAIDLGLELPGGATRTFYLHAAFLRGRCYFSTEQWDKAEEWFTKVVDSDVPSDYKDNARKMLKRIPEQ